MDMVLRPRRVPLSRKVNTTDTHKSTVSMTNALSAAFSYKSSPFYEVTHRIGELKTLDGILLSLLAVCTALLNANLLATPAMPTHRSTVTINVKAQDHAILQKFSLDTSLKVMVFCAGGNTGNAQDVSFPHQAELKVNGDDIKANLRGLKNKPGSTRPVDITSALRLKPASYNNVVEFTYALTQKVGSMSILPTA
jgi:E3 SUMO-protein ligase PIAS1